MEQLLCLRSGLSFSYYSICISYHDSSNQNWNMNMGASSHLANNTGKHAKLPFYNSESSVNSVFEIIHSDIWTSPIPSESGIKYYAIFLDHFLHFVWVYPLHKKVDLFDNFVAFRAYVNKQFNVDIKALQWDHASNKIIISRHVRFDEDIFPFGNVTSSNKPTYDFLLPPIQSRTNVPTTPPITPHPTTPPTSPPQPDTYLSHSSTLIPTLAQTQSHAQTVDSHTTIPINNSSQTMSTHPMVTRAKAGIFKPLERMNCHVTTTSPLPRSHVHALRDPNWKEAMLDEYNALITNGTWVLVPRPANVNVVRSMWLFKHKFNADGSLSRYKARLVANGRSQQQGIDCDETFSPVVKPATIRTVLSLAVSREWPIHQLDVKNAFLHGHLTETVYMHQPPGFVDSVHPDYVCHLQRSLYGLKQAPRAWFQRFASFVTRIGFQHSKTDTSLFVFHRGPDVAYLLLYVDDIILTASSTTFLQRIISLLHGEFAMTDLGSLNYFLGVSAQRTASGMFLSQSKFAVEILERANMQKCNPCKTPVDTESKLGPDGEPVSDLLYIAAWLHILRYVRGTIDHGLHLHVSSTAQLTAYTDADWAGCPVTRRSTSGYCVFLGDNLLSWSAKRQVTLSRSSAEAEYRGVANVVAETAWLRNLLLELHAPLSTATIVYCDNVSAVYLSTNSVQHQRTKHIEIDIHFVRDYVASGQVRVLHVPSRYQYADIFTKALLSIFERGEIERGEFENVKLLNDLLMEKTKKLGVTGLVYAGVGWVVWRTKEDLHDELVFHINYLGSDEPTFTLNFSKGDESIIEKTTCDEDDQQRHL
ncbi:ribonuclease H-like domain-containing protein [Tanacetum coccineum]